MEKYRTRQGKLEHLLWFSRMSRFGLKNGRLGLEVSFNRILLWYRNLFEVALGSKHDMSKRDLAPKKTPIVSYCIQDSDQTGTRWFVPMLISKMWFLFISTWALRHRKSSSVLDSLFLESKYEIILTPDDLSFVRWTIIIHRSSLISVAVHVRPANQFSNPQRSFFLLLLLLFEFQQSVFRRHPYFRWYSTCDKYCGFWDEQTSTMDCLKMNIWWNRWRW